MTRISSSIKAVELCDKHLIKERIEILRIPNAIKSGKAKVDLNKINTKFTLGTGHVTFFYNKNLYLLNRYIELTNECLKRGFNVTDYSDAFNDLPINLFNDWDDNQPYVRKMLKERVNERLINMKNIKYYSVPIEIKDILTFF